MKLIIPALLSLLSINPSNLCSQSLAGHKLYAHKVIVEEIVQTKNYTYLNVKECIKGADSIQWMALPLFEPVVGETYYFENGLPMGEFQSKELNRTFKQILFLSEISKSPEIAEKNMLTGLPISPPDSVQKNTPQPIVHTVVVKEVLQTSGYTYLRVKEGRKEEWLAVVKIRATVGQTFTFDDAAEMSNFTSKELKRTFKNIYFLAKLKPVSNFDNKESELKDVHISVSKSDSKEDKIYKKTLSDTLKVEISIASLLENKKLYSGKKIIIKGKVTKFSASIMNKNWIHIQDGTSFSGKKDLTITSTQEVKIGDNIRAEGTITLDKDFGSGYFFDVIMEDAEL